MQLPMKDLLSQLRKREESLIDINPVTKQPKKMDLVFLRV